MSVILSNKQGGIVTSFEMTNFSTAKQKFSFGKGPRFPSVKKSITDMNYELPNCFGKRAPSFGVGDRFNSKVDRSGKFFISFIILSFEEFSFYYNSNLQIIVDNPSPDSYQLNSSFDFNASSSVMKSKAFTFGMSREAFNKVYIPS